MTKREIGCKRALITGATGFVGSNLVRGLLNKGWVVDVIIRPTSSLKMLMDIKGSLSIHIFNGKIEQMLDIVLKATPDVVFHVASMVVGEHRPEQAKELISSNIIFGSQLLEAMSENGVSRFINTGTYWEHYENKHYNPVNFYAATKHAFQAILQYYVEAKGIKAVTLKLFDPYGPNDPRPKLLNLLTRVAATGESFAMSPGEQEIDLVHIYDVVRAYKVAAMRLVDGKVEGHEIYGVGSGQPVTLKAIVALIEKQSGKKINIEWGGKEYRDRELMLPWSDFRKLTGWDIQISLENGLRQLQKNYFHNMEL